jgi:signal transduction histidine kinase
MQRADDRLRSALRRMRALDAEGEALARMLLEVVASATASTSAALRGPVDAAGEVCVGSRLADAEPARLEQRFAARSGTVSLEIERPASAPYDEGDALVLELAGGEAVSRLERARAETEARRLRREIDVVRALTRAAEGAPRPFDVADRAAGELLDTFTGAHVLVHMMTDDRLELIARRTHDGLAVADTPVWGRLVPLESSTIMAVAARQRRTVSRATETVEQPRRAYLEERGIRHLLSVPLSIHDVVLGTLTLAHRRDEPWDAESLRLLDGVAAQLASELAQARLLEAERRRAEDLALINELGSLVAQHLELRAVLSTVGTALARTFEVSRVHVLVADAEKVHLHGVAATTDAVDDVALSVASSRAAEDAFRDLSPVVLEDVQHDPRADQDLLAQFGARALAVVPLLGRDGAIGIIALVETGDRKRFTETEIARAVAVANVVAAAVTNAQMFEDLRRSYQALAKAQADVVRHERLAALGELSAVIAHEVRNPVAIIFNSLSELRRVTLPEPRATFLLDIVREETARLNRIVGDLLDFVRPYDAHPRPIDLDGVVRGAVDAARRAAPEPSLAIDTEVRPPSRTIVLDGTMLQQALLNLIVNAIQATPSGKHVTVSARVVSGAAGDALACEIADEGSGFDDAVAARMFQPFFTTKATGTGLGLALVRRLTDALGGTVIAQNRPSGGAVFSLTVPLTAAPADDE